MIVYTRRKSCEIVFGQGFDSPRLHQNKTTVFDRKLSFYFGLRPDMAGLAPFYHLTAEVNSAYDNSPLCSELTRHSARPPVGGIYSVGITQTANLLLCNGLAVFLTLPTACGLSGGRYICTVSGTVWAVGHRKLRTIFPYRRNSPDRGK